MHWSEIFLREDFRFRLGLRPADPAEFFAPTAAHEEIVAERQRWIREFPGRHCCLEDGARPYLQETAKALGRLHGFSATEIAHDLGSQLEPDLVLVDNSPANRARALLVCFPSSWAPEEKLGRPLAEIHQPVPNLNPELGARIASFLQHLKPHAAWSRTNWSLTRSTERNQHTLRNVARLDDANQDEPTNVWLRLEHQLLWGLPNGAGIVFGIRLEQVSWAELAGHDAAREAFRQQLLTMPESVAQYKGFAATRHLLASRLK